MRLARRTCLTLVAPAAAAATLAAVAVGGGAPASDAAAQGSQAAERLELTIRGREMRVRLIDEPPLRRGRRFVETQGDQAVQDAPLRDASGAVVGRMASIFTTTKGGTRNTREHVTATMDLRDGQITAQGVIGSDTEKDVLAITGGTGRYAGVRGTMTAVTGRDDVEIALELTR